jgi:hypothetical protein
MSDIVSSSDSFVEARRQHVIDPPAFRRTYVIVRLALGVLLLAAAALKGYQLITAPGATNDLLTSGWPLILTIGFEFGLGLLLAMGLYANTTWQIAFFSFGAFAAFSLYRGFIGDRSCGCFGGISINPWVMFVFDLMAAGVLWLWQPSSLRTSEHRVGARRRASRVVLTCLVVGIPGAWAMTTFATSQIDANGNLLGNGPVVVLEPAKWVGKSFPLRDHIDVAEQLSSGQWRVVLYHHDCAPCKTLISKYEALPSSSLPVVLVEIPPFAPQGVSSALDTPQLFRGRLSQNRRWFVKTPLEVDLNNGKVVRVAQDGGRID